MYNRYHGNTGRVERVEEPRPQRPPPQPGAHGAHRPPPTESRPPGPVNGLSGNVMRLLGRLSPARLETEDLLLIAVLYLLYRECGDREFLIAIAAYLFL